MWFHKKYNNLTLDELEQIFRLRQSIFIIEQKSFFEDIDGNDKNAIHIFKKEENEIWAYVRLLIYNDKIILGRVTVKRKNRKNGNGRLLLNEALSYINDYYPNKNIEIVAMSYLKEFYKSLGFKTVSDVYYMDNHPHENMVLSKNKFWGVKIGRNYFKRIFQQNQRWRND